MGEDDFRLAVFEFYGCDRFWEFLVGEGDLLQFFFGSVDFEADVERSSFFGGEHFAFGADDVEDHVVADRVLDEGDVDGSRQFFVELADVCFEGDDLGVSEGEVLGDLDEVFPELDGAVVAVEGLLFCQEDGRVRPKLDVLGVDGMEQIYFGVKVSCPVLVDDVLLSLHDFIRNRVLVLKVNRESDQVLLPVDLGHPTDHFLQVLLHLLEFNRLVFLNDCRHWVQREVHQMREEEVSHARLQDELRQFFILHLLVEHKVVDQLRTVELQIVTRDRMRLKTWINTAPVQVRIYVLLVWHRIQ